ncbi:uncharacterized protein JN550_009258 [Neoarthrinium moseri]|uniref:uncharacterized protein n=1 Tax=Neoarthrinium moseri TaxID=1658444 RepID=UPI001FDC0EBA|nr:uncharacterized protein JN550_009258 [Neoarthrinium moseri]KAI1863979.1 hypothetical protein JN550_009258 [Neoarthrinium moseri]
MASDSNDDMSMRSGGEDIRSASDLSEGIASPGSRVESPVSEEITGPASPPPAGDQVVQEENIIHARAYQLEMLEESLKRNVIVVMDTGSGKTQVAILRMRAALENSPSGKIVWFLVPTVALCYQQLQVIQSQIPGVQSKPLTGNDGIDTWSNTSIWNAFLENVSIVVSTYQVLSQALDHAFVQTDSLSLLVFDEAHNCVGDSPGRKIMTRYQENKQAGIPVPAILGLTASPTINASTSGLEIIERTLDAVCRTPTRHRAELLRQVKRPVMFPVPYGPGLNQNDPGIETQTMRSLMQAYLDLDINNDPYIVRKLAENTERSYLELQRAWMKQDTYVFKQMASFCRKSTEIRCELGPWAADYYIRSAITQYLDYANKSSQNNSAWELAEKRYLAGVLQKVELAQADHRDNLQVSSKVTKLIEQLVSCPANVQGIVFVKETATTHVLQRLLSMHKLTRTRFRTGSMVGASRYEARKRDVGELNRNDGLVDLELFRSGKLDILIATSVLEEGIDVPACNLVVCFDRPTHLKSFIQRRGRARMRESKLILMYDISSDSHMAWEKHEEEMRQHYEDQSRELKKLKAIEDAEIPSVAPFYTKHARARLELDDAKGHLDHFCGVIASREFVEWRPYYIITKVPYTRAKFEPPQVKATVVLPNSLPAHLRRIDGNDVWYSEKNACKDAAFEAYKRLYEAGLVNENLMPLKGNDLVEGLESRLSEIEVDERWNPWPHVARAWSGSQYHRYPVQLLDRSNAVLAEFSMVSPVQLPSIPMFDVFWGNKSWKVKISQRMATVVDLSRSAEETMALITLAYGHRFEVEDGRQHVIQFHSHGKPISRKDLGSQTITSGFLAQESGELQYLIRKTMNNSPYFYGECLPSEPSYDLVRKKRSNYEEAFLQENPFDGPWLALKRWPRRRDFLHEIRQDAKPEQRSAKPYEYIWPAAHCRMDSTPIVNVQFASLIPSITHILEIYLLGQELSTNTDFKELAFNDLRLLVTAISASSAREADDYQRLEFLGDVLLKLLSTISVAVNRPHFPEGYLSKMRVRMLSNSRLCKSSRDFGLARFIHTKEFTGHKWRPFYVDELASKEEVSGKRTMSTKILADVVESLTGAAYVDGGLGYNGLDKALRCLRLLIPGDVWRGLDEGRTALLSLRESKSKLPPTLAPLESLLGYSFSCKSLLVESMTHSSFNLASSNEQSLERLEFIGDAILDYLIVMELWERNLPESRMSPLRAACVNADLVGFLGMEWSISQHTANIENAVAVPAEFKIPFWKFMRHSSEAVGAVQKAAEERHALERDAILQAISSSRVYPWVLLSHIHIPKFFSDIFESVLAAVWLDSGDMSVCRSLLERIGILPFLRRILEDNVDVTHPKNKLGEIAGQRLVEYKVGLVTAEEAAYVCKVFVGDELVVEVGGGNHKDEVITKAAEKAYEVLRAKSDAEADAMEVDV